MPKVLYVISSLEPEGAAKQLSLLGPGLPRDRFQGHICVLGRTGPFAAPLEEAGLPVTALGWSRRLDPRPVIGLRRLVREFAPDVVHVWGATSLRAVRLAAGSGARRDESPRRLVVSTPLPAGVVGRDVGWLDRWLLRQADRVVAQGPAEADRCLRLGLCEGRVAVVEPAVAARPDRADGGADLRHSLRLPEAGRLVVCAGPLEPYKGFRDAIWTFEILRYVAPDLHLLIIGDGSDRRRLEADAAIGKSDQIHFLGPHPDAAAILALADVVWVPSRAGGGVNVALEAMAAGRPVVATRLHSLAEVVAEGVTGYLVAPGDREALARQTWLLLRDAGQRRRLGEAGKDRAADRFAVQALRRRYIDLYESVAA